MTIEARQQKAESLLRAAGILPVVTGHTLDEARKVSEALLKGGLPAIELTLRTPVAMDALAMLKKELPDIVIGAGTVLSERDLQAAIDAGARYALSPGGTPKLMEAARGAAIPFIPGVATSSEIMRGLELGYTHFKFFPAEQLGGVAWLKAQAGPLPQARFCPTGGVSLEKAPAYLALDNVLCVGGSWLAPADKINARDWSGIEAAARSAAGLR